jgi:hypothetical protein
VIQIRNRSKFVSLAPSNDNPDGIVPIYMCSAREFEKWALTILNGQ